MSVAIIARNAYVGTAKSAPAWRTPRRFPASSRPMTATPIGTVSGASAGTADVIAATPAAIDTATVST
jgi:hypothetical protein